MAWGDSRNDVLGDENRDIFVQHVLADGTIAPGWSPIGNPVCTDPAPQFIGSAVADGFGGMLLVWTDYRNAFGGPTAQDIYAQRILADGSVAPGWPVDGAPVTQAPGNQNTPTLAPDGLGGAYFTWDDRTVRDIYAQHLTGTGQVAPGWPANGLPVCTLAGVQGSPQVIPDGAGGVLISWGDLRTGNQQMYADRFLADGTLSPGWTPSGTLMVQGSAPRDMAEDGAGGAYLASATFGTAADTDFFLQHFSGAGGLAPGWPIGGAPVCIQQPYDRGWLRTVSDGQGGALLAWGDYRYELSGGDDEIFLHRFRADGTLAPGFPSNGLRVTNYGGFDDEVDLVGDGLGGAYLCWSRDDGQNRVVAQHITGAGAVAAGWPPNGLAIPGLGNRPRITADGIGGAIAAWEAYDGTGTVRALRFNVDGPVPTLVSLARAEAAPGLVRITWYAADRPGLLATLERRTEQSEWQSVAILRADGTGKLLYEDRGVTAGVRYAYRLRYSEGGNDQTTAESWVTVPGFVFALAGLVPNPSDGPVRVGFALPSGERAMVEVYDVTGRRMVAREVGGLGPGEHVLDLSREIHLPAGVYQLRLSQSGRQAIRRAVVLR